jgi:hypothetical protein
MPVAQASKEAYGRMKSVGPKEHPVYKLLKTFGAGSDGYSNRQIAAIMGKPINTITPRVFELRQAGVVVLAGKRKDLYSGVEVSHWRIASEAEEQAFREPSSAREILTKGVDESGSQPREWLHLADIPEGVVVQERGDWSWLWRRLPDGRYVSSASQGKKWSTPGHLEAKEPFYGPVTEVKG